MDTKNLLMKSQAGNHNVIGGQIIRPPSPQTVACFLWWPSFFVPSLSGISFIGCSRESSVPGFSFSLLKIAS